MAEITLHRTGQLLRKLFEILLTDPDGLSANEALQRLADSVSMTPYEAGAYGQGGRRFERIVRMATIDCVKAGWLWKAAGTWTVTQAGQDALRTYVEPDSFYREATRRFRAWKAQQSRPPSGTTEPTVVAEVSSTTEGTAKSADVTADEARDRAWSEIRSFIAAMDPFTLQRLSGALLRAMGYHILWEAPAGPDGGVDLIASTDPLGIKLPRIKIQVKRVSDKVTSDTVRSFTGILKPGETGIFISAGGFTRDAESFIRNQSLHPVTLINLERFVSLWTEHYSQLDSFAQRAFPLTPVYFLTPEF